MRDKTLMGVELIEVRIFVKNKASKLLKILYVIVGGICIKE